MNKVTLSNKYQVIIPKEAREKIDLKAGISFEVIIFSNRIELIPLFGWNILREQIPEILYLK